MRCAYFYFFIDYFAVFVNIHCYYQSEILLNSTSKRRAWRAGLTSRYYGKLFDIITRLYQARVPESLLATTEKE